MSVRKIVKIGESLLREKSVVVDNFNSPALNKLAEDLRDTLTAFRGKYRYGRGISAVQIGMPKRVIYIKTREFEDCMVNPKITNRSHRMFWTWDSCFSADIAFFVKIRRHYSIKVEYRDIKGEKLSLVARGGLAELLQHEIDHLSGKLFIDYLNDGKNQFFMKEVFEKIKKSL